MKYIIKISVALVFCLNISLFAQQEVNYNGKIFKPAEVIETQIGTTGETFSLYISEIDMSPNGDWAKRLEKLRRQGKEPNPDEVPKPLSLDLTIDLKKTFKFPITPQDSVYINFSYVKENIEENIFNKAQIKKMSSSLSNTDVSSFKTQKVSIEEEAQRISKLLQEGKISPDEAIKKIEALTKPMTDKLNTSAIMNQENSEYKNSRSTYSILFVDSTNDTESTPYEGTLHIIEFNSKRLVANFNGVHYVECLDVVRKNNVSKPCEKEETGLFPGHKVLKKENISIKINTLFKDFSDNRN